MKSRNVAVREKAGRSRKADARDMLTIRSLLGQLLRSQVGDAAGSRASLPPLVGSSAAACRAAVDVVAVSPVAQVVVVGRVGRAVGVAIVGGILIGDAVEARCLLGDEVLIVEVVPVQAPLPTGWAFRGTRARMLVGLRSRLAVGRASSLADTGGGIEELAPSTRDGRRGCHPGVGINWTGWDVEPLGKLDPASRPLCVTTRPFPPQSRACLYTPVDLAAKCWWMQKQSR